MTVLRSAGQVLAAEVMGCAADLAVIRDEAMDLTELYSVEYFGVERGYSGGCEVEGMDRPCRPGRMRLSLPVANATAVVRTSRDRVVIRRAVEHRIAAGRRWDGVWRSVEYDCPTGGLSAVRAG